MVTLEENNTEMQLTPEQYSYLVQAGMVYYCEECGLWHIDGGCDWDDIDSALSELRKG